MFCQQRGTNHIVAAEEMWIVNRESYSYSLQRTKKCEGVGLVENLEGMTFLFHLLKHHDVTVGRL